MNKFRIVLLSAVLLGLFGFDRARSLTLDYARAPQGLPDAMSQDGVIKEWMNNDPATRRQLDSLSHPRPMPGFDSEKDDLKDAPAALAAPSSASFVPSWGRPLMEHLPGFAPAPFATCRTLVGCTEAPESFTVENASQIEDAVGAILRPWVLLQEARGSAIELMRTPGNDDRIARVKLSGDPAVTFLVRAAPEFGGRYRVWIAGATSPATLYLLEREQALAANPTPTP